MTGSVTPARKKRMESRMLLSSYIKPVNLAGRGRLVQILWYVVSNVLFSSALPGSKWRCSLLSVFGADLGCSTVIKPRVVIKFPWKLSVGDNSWIGEAVWIDNLAPVSIGSDACISQGAYLCTGSHNWSSERFDLVVKPISIGNQSWVCARSIIGPGTQIGEGGVVGLGCVFTGTLEPWTIVGVQGNTRRRSRISEVSRAHE